MAMMIFDNVWGALTIKQCSTAAIQLGNTIDRGRASSAFTASEIYLMSSRPRVRFTTLDLATVLAAVSPSTGLSISNTNLKFQGRVLTNGGSFATGSDVYIGSTAGYGTLIPVSLTANGANFATLDLEAAIRSSDGHTAPIGYTGSQTLGTASFTSTYQQGPTTIGGSGVTGIVRWTANFGIVMQVAEQPTDGGIYPTEIYLHMADPFVDITFRDQAHLNTYGPIFSANTSALFTLRKKADGGTVVALSDSSSITLTLGAGLNSVEDVTGQTGQLVEPTLRMHAKSITVATGVDLTA